MFVNKNRSSVSPRYSFREQLSLISSCSESWDRLRVGASSPFWEPWVRYCTNAKQFHILFTDTGLTVCATQSCPARFRSVVCERSFCPGGCSPESCPSHYCSNRIFWLLSMCHVSPLFVLLPVDAAWDGGGIHFLQTQQVPQASSWHKQKCKLGKGDLTLRLWALWSKDWAVRTLAQGHFGLVGA